MDGDTHMNTISCCDGSVCWRKHGRMSLSIREARSELARPIQLEYQMELTSRGLVELITCYANHTGEYPEVITMHPDVLHKFEQHMKMDHILVQDDKAYVGIAQFYGIPILPKRNEMPEYVQCGRMCDLFSER